MGGAPAPGGKDVRTGRMTSQQVIAPFRTVPYPRRVHRLHAVQRLLDLSTDPGNPTVEELDELFHRMTTIAVVGISRDPLKTARRIPSYLRAKGYDIIPVNPQAERIFGRDAVDCLDDLATPLDMVLVFRPSAAAGPIVERAAARPERPAIWLQEGIWAPEEIGAAREAGLTAVQNLCSYKVHRELQAAEVMPLVNPEWHVLNPHAAD